MRHPLFALLACCLLPAAVGLAEDSDEIKFPSPDDHLALRLHETATDNDQAKAAIIEKTTGKVVLELEVPYPGNLDDTVVVWSRDSKWFAYGTCGPKEGGTTVYHRGDAVFEALALPENRPEPHIKFSKRAAAGGMKNYGGAVKPLRWLATGELELSSDLTMLSHVDESSYTGVVRFTVRFDKKHHASVYKVGKTKTTVDE